MLRCPSIGRALVRGLAALALPVACLLPPASTAREEISNDDGHDVATGDPLDTNDFGSGGGVGDRNQYDPRWPGVQSATPPAPAGAGRRILLIPINQGGLLTFRLIVIDERLPSPEAVDAR
jgi:hypothetical protein